MNSSDEFHTTTAVRGYVADFADIGFSNWSLTIHITTIADEFDSLLFGIYQLRKGTELHLAGVFFNPSLMTANELDLLEEFCLLHKLTLLTVTEFLEEVFFTYVYELDALCIGFDLARTLSRLAIEWAPARGRMKGGFSFKFWHDTRRPRLQIKQLQNGASFIRFAQAYRSSTRRPGYFVDDKTLASALLGRSSWTLKSLSKHLGTSTRKQRIPENGQTLSASQLENATREVQAIWECYEKLRDHYESFGLTKTPINRIYSEASIGKAYLVQMGVLPFL